MDFDLKQKEFWSITRLKTSSIFRNLKVDAYPFKFENNHTCSLPNSLLGVILQELDFSDQSQLFLSSFPYFGTIAVLKNNFSKKFCTKLSPLRNTITEFFEAGKSINKGSFLLFD